MCGDTRKWLFDHHYCEIMRFTKPRRYIFLNKNPSSLLSLLFQIICCFIAKIRQNRIINLSTTKKLLIYKYLGTMYPYLNLIKPCQTIQTWIDCFICYQNYYFRYQFDAKCYIFVNKLLCDIRKIRTHLILVNCFVFAIFFYQNGTYHCGLMAYISPRFGTNT